MNKKEFKEACILAFNNTMEKAFDTIDIFNGFGLRDFKPVTCTVKDVAGLLKWQCLMFNGQIDHNALNEVWENRKKFIVVD